MLTNLVNKTNIAPIEDKVNIEYDVFINRDKTVSQTFGKLIRQARKDKDYTQRELAKLIGVDYTYLSKLENDHAGYPPSEEVIGALALHLDLTQREDDLRRLAGRITPEDARVFEELIKKYQEMPALLRRMRDEPDFAQKLLRENRQIESEENHR
ncbi:helix-turn-helix domain-containing protein [Oscillatoria acuminata]|uniref:Helix-turn-helix protein n=1 Tax=Oscillatoria acuminata PCC 6304 TaxID=56110 RepID=K9TN58_9CYAN|nr:Helix-turn-helix protein [Oscillatoria acuminata PCC 6304]